MKTERKSAGDFFISVCILCLKYLMTQMITKTSTGYAPYLYTQIKYKSITVYIKNKKGGSA